MQQGESRKLIQKQHIKSNLMLNRFMAATYKMIFPFSKEWQRIYGKRGRVAASYTVEAAFIIPIILGIFFALLYFLYYEHDKALLYANIKQGVIYLAKDQGNMPDDIEWRKQLQKNLWMAKVDSGSVSQTVMQVKGSGRAQMNLQIPVMEYFLNRQQTIQWSYHYDRWQPEQILRQKDTVVREKEQ